MEREKQVKRKGEVIWESVRNTPDEKGQPNWTAHTYVKSKHGLIGTQYKTGSQKRAERRAA